jgi:hypothetical protein
MVREGDVDGFSSVETVRVRVLPDGRVSRANAALIFGRSPKTLAEWRSKGWGPRPIEVGGRIFHDFAECMAMARGEKPIKPAEAA